MGMIPMTGVDDAIAELEYRKRAGLRGICLSQFPSGKSFPSLDDDLYAAVLDLDMPLTVHVGFDQSSGPIFTYPRRPVEAIDPGSDPMIALARFGGGIAQTAIQMVFGGVFERFPSLKVYFAETMVGWVGYCYEELDDIHGRIRHWAERDYGLERARARPARR